PRRGLGGVRLGVPGVVVCLLREPTAGMQEAVERLHSQGYAGILQYILGSVGQVPSTRLYPGQVSLVFLIGSGRMRLPLAGNSAVQSAGIVGGTPGSPTPAGTSWLGRRCTCVS